MFGLANAVCNCGKYIPKRNELKILVLAWLFNFRVGNFPPNFFWVFRESSGRFCMVIAAEQPVGISF